MRAGFPSPAEDLGAKRIDVLDKLVIHPQATFTMHVRGDSMIEFKIFDGDVILVDRAIKERHGHIVVAVLDNEFLINAVGSTVHRLPSFRQAFRETRCLIPMSGWWEWPTIEGKKTRVDITMKTRPTFLAAGLYEISKDNKTGEPVPTYTLVTTEPNDYLGSAHDRAPLVLEPGQYLDWLAGGDRAMALIHQHDDPAAFNIEVSGDPQKTIDKA